MSMSTMAESPSSSQPEPLKLSETNIEDGNVKKKSKKMHPCSEPECDKVFTCHFNLRKHLQKAHKIESVPAQTKANIKCLHPSCTAQFVHVTKMLSHLESEHGVEIQREYLNFKTLDEFYKWKENEQTTNFVYFSKYQGLTAPKDSNILVLYFKCQRDGSSRPHREKGHKPKTTKTRGTVKMNMVCPARMVVKVSKEDGSVAVDYIQSHSHPITAEDSRRQPMPSSLRDDIENRLASGQTEDQIMTELTGGAYLPTGKQGNRSGSDRRGDRSSINYGIPVDNGIYFINKKRLSTMKRRLKVAMQCTTTDSHSDAQTATESSVIRPPPAKKKKTADDIALEVAGVRGQLKELLRYLDDPEVCKAMLPDIKSLVTYLISSCSKAKENINISESQTGTNGAPPQLTDKNTEEPTVYFSDDKNFIKVAIKKRSKAKQVATDTLGDSNGCTLALGIGSTVPVALTKVNESQTAQVIGTSVAGIADPQSRQTVTDSVIGDVPAPPSVTGILPSSAASDSAVDQTSSVGDNTSVECETAVVEIPPLANPSVEEQQQIMEVSPENQIEMIQVIEHYEQSQQQTPILYNLPTEGAYVTVCDVDGTVSVDGAGGTIVGGESQQEGQASILLNAIMAANLCGTEQNTSTDQNT